MERTAWPIVAARICALSCVLALAACSGSDSDSGAEPPAAAPPTETPPETPPPAETPPPEATPTDNAIPPLASTPLDISNNRQIGSVYWPDGSTSVGGTGQVVEGLPCGEMDESYHVHTQLSLFLNGEQLALPRNIGIVQLSPSSDCHYALHTHDYSGKIHVEAPEPQLFTLGQFFAIWGQPLERDNIGGHSGLPVAVYVTDDGVATRYEGELADIELSSHRGITIEIGTPITEIPRYDWSGN